MLSELNWARYIEILKFSSKLAGSKHIINDSKKIPALIEFANTTFIPIIKRQCPSLDILAIKNCLEIRTTSKKANLAKPIKYECKSISSTEKEIKTSQENFLANLKLQPAIQENKSTIIHNLNLTQILSRLSKQKSSK